MKLFFSKNTPESEILEYTSLPSKVQSDVTPVNDSNELDVTNVEVDKNIVEDALNNGGMETPVENEDKVLDKEVDEVATQETPNLGAEINADMGNTQILSTLPEIEAEDEVQEENTELPLNEEINLAEENKEEVPEETNLSGSEGMALAEETPIEENKEEASEEPNLLADEGMTLTEETPVEENKEEASEEPNLLADEGMSLVEETPVEEKEDEIEETNESTVEDEKVEDKEEIVSEEPELDIPVADTEVEDKDEEVQLDLKDDEIEMDDSIEVSDEEDMPAVDSMYNELDEPEFNESYDTYEEKNTYGVDDFSDRNTVLTDVAKSMSSLIRKTKSLKDQNTRYQAKIGKLTEAGRIKDEKIRMQEQKITALESAKKRLEMRDESSQSQIRELKREIANLRREKETMKPGYDELARVLADSREVLEEDPYGNGSMYRKVV